MINCVPRIIFTYTIINENKQDIIFSLFFIIVVEIDYNVGTYSVYCTRVLKPMDARVSVSVES